ncbi:MAG: hypothetical protein Q7S75_00240 [bacterium]|nr:hypothetical protein [bacterium]
MKFKHQTHSVKRIEERNPLIRKLFAIRYSPHASSRGFTLLLASLVASITLAFGLSIFAITQKQIILSSIGRDSQFAFYTADTGAECALYWDIRHAYFGTSTPPATALCDNQTLDMSGRPPENAPDPYPYTIIFQFEPGDLCAQVSVTKRTTNPQTTIHSDGFNVRCAAISVNPRSLQRTVEINY